LQKALAEVLMSDPDYYARLGRRFAAKRTRAVGVLEELGFRIYDSGSTFYIWARIPEQYPDAMRLNEQLIAQAGVAAVPGSAFTDSDRWDNYMRLCIAREDHILDAALGKLHGALTRGLSD
jgi:aspartate/methionine/tyrosine aminotransferase